MSMWGKVAVVIAAIVFVPIAAAIFALAAFLFTGLFTGMIFGALDALGIAEWNDETFLIVTVPLAVVFAVVAIVFRDRIRES